MWLFAKYLIGLLSAIQGLHFTYVLDTDASNDPCIAKIRSCDWYRQPFSLYKGKNVEMFTKIEDLNKACKKQTGYIRCIVRAEKFCEQMYLLPMAEEMIKNRRFPAELCRPTSPWQQLYLNEASCLNAYSRKTFVYCAEKNGIDHSNLDTFELVCKYGKAIIDCSATVLQEKCGYYAGNILKKLLTFHSLTDFKCSELKREEIDAYTSSSTPDYETTGGTFNVLDAAVFGKDFNSEATEKDVNTNFGGQTSSHSSISEEDAFFDFNNQHTEESFKTKYFFTDSIDSDAESQDTILEFPALPKYDYIHKNKTTFALYEDLEMGHMKYMGCGEADFFWVILSPLRSKYCVLADLKSEYSEALFKCTLRIDSPCTPELDDEDRSKRAEVFHRRYVVTILTPPNNQRSEDMVVMNVHYLKFYPSPSTHVPEKNVNLWTAQENKANIEQTEHIGRKGPLELGDIHSDTLQHSNGSGQKWDANTMNSSPYLDKDEYFEKYQKWDDHPLEEESAYFPELLTNNIIHIEDDKGDLISLHDHRSPVHMKSVYQPHSLLRPRIGAMLTSTDPKHFQETGQVSFQDSSESSSFKKQISEFQDDALVSKIKPNHQEYSAKAPCAPDSEFISGFKTKPDMNILSRNIKSLDELEETNQPRQKIPSFIKLNEGFDLKQFIYKDVYVVTPSAKIEVPKSIEKNQAKRHNDEFASDHSKYSHEENEFTTIGSRYV